LARIVRISTVRVYRTQGQVCLVGGTAVPRATVARGLRGTVLSCRLDAEKPMNRLVGLMGKSVVTIFLAAPVAAAQAPTTTQNDAPNNAPVDCAELPVLTERLARADKILHDWPNLARYAEANAALTAPPKFELRVVFMGDSITDAWVSPEYGGFFPGKPYVDRGISGQTTPQMLIRFRPDVIALQPKG